MHVELLFSRLFFPQLKRTVRLLLSSPEAQQNSALFHVSFLKLKGTAGPFSYLLLNIKGTVHLFFLLSVPRAQAFSRLFLELNRTGNQFFFSPSFFSEASANNSSPRVGSSAVCRGLVIHQPPPAGQHLAGPPLVAGAHRYSPARPEGGWPRKLTTPSLNVTFRCIADLSYAKVASIMKCKASVIPKSVLLRLVLIDPFRWPPS